MAPVDNNFGNTAIALRNVSKNFYIHHDRANTIKDRFVRFMTRKGHSRSSYEELKAVKNISLDIARSSVVGLVGPNGSGKSTLLRLIAGIYPASEGSVHVNGTVAPLIGLNLGFHPQLTGEENIYLNASLFGYSRKQIKEMYPRIVEFSELGHFIDTPINKYSSGMLSRLGYSIATQISAEICLLDEILAVGDAHFREKCLSKIREQKESGKTILIVTHSIESILDLCDRSLMMISGEIVSDGPPDAIAKEYKAYMSKHGSLRHRVQPGKV